MMASDGSGVERLTTNPGTFDGYASWSPDGDKIAFTSHRDSNLEIYVLSTVGNGAKKKFKHLTRLTDHAASDSHPTWSPDGSKMRSFDSGWNRARSASAARARKVFRWRWTTG